MNSSIEQGGKRDIEQAYWLRRTGFTAAPILAGIDKFYDRMVVWDEYLSPAIAKRVPVSPKTFMKIVGVVEVAAGVLVAVRPRVGAVVVSGWLAGIIGNLLTHPRRYLDIALRDLGLSLGALALSRLDAARVATERPPRSLQPARKARLERPVPQQVRAPSDQGVTVH